MTAEQIIQLIENKREIQVAKRLEHMQKLNKKGIRKPDKTAKAISKKVSLYTKLLNEIREIIEIEHGLSAPETSKRPCL